MDNIRFDFSDFHRYGSAFYDFLALRKQVFVDQLGWDVPHNAKVEMDQYDTPGLCCTNQVMDEVSPFPGQTYPTVSVTGMPSAVKPFRTATRIWNSAT